MRVKTKVTSLVSGFAVGAAFIVAPSASATTGTPETLLTKEPRNHMAILPIGESTNSAITVKTELDCNSHTVTATVQNNTQADITPKVTFDGLPSSYNYEPTVKPGKTATYTYSYTGNNSPMQVKVKVDGQTDTVLNPRLNCQEPVSFRADAVSSSAVTGYLSNNSSLLPQTVLLRVGMGDVRTEILAPGESRLVALPFTGMPEQQYAFITIATAGSGLESTYSVNLRQQLPPVVPLDIKQ
jgi:hypothetical protein